MSPLERMLQSALLRGIRYLEIEEKILNLGSLIAIIGIFMPWFGGEWFGEPQVWTGFGFYTSFVGLMIFLAHLFTLSLTLLPMLGYQLVRPSLKHLLRFIIGLESVLLVIVVLSVLTNISFDFSQVEIRFGVYLTLVGSIVVALYAFLRMQQQQKRSVEQLFRHPEEPPTEPRRTPTPAPHVVTSPPPSAPPVEDLSLFR